jgi:2-keto-4-pentenoate hydratase/2-oxohepta-3-ene-1,7-dioic acid hydratase in catechol pathway
VVYLVSYRSEPTAPFWHAGVVRERVLVDLSQVADQSTSRQYEGERLSVRSFLSRSQHEREDLLTSALHHLDRGNHLLTLDQVELGPPVPDPEKFLCVGLNYRAHASEVNAALPPVPTIFAKFRNSLVGPTSPIVLPTVSKLIDYEGELTVVIGTRCQGVSEQEALDYVAGYTVCNDVSARDLQMQTSQWTAGKAIDTFAPMGPGIVLAEMIPDPQTLLLTTRVNGEVVQHDNTANMIYSVATIIAFLSSFMTLEPGDLIATGTPSGVGGMRQPPLFLRDGDLVEVEIESIGVIRNPVIAPTHAESNEREIGSHP